MATGNDVNVRLDSDVAEDIVDLVDVLFASETRIRTFWCIRQGITSTSDIAAEVGCNEGTVAGAKGHFRDYGLMDDDELTRLGELVADELPCFLETATNVGGMKPFVNLVSRHGLTDFWDVFEQLADGEIIDNDNRADTERKYRRLVKQSDKVRELVPWRTGQGHVFQEQIEVNELEGEFLFYDEKLEKLLTTDSEAEFLYKLNRSGATLLENPKHQLPDFSLGIFDDTVSLMARGERYVLIKSENDLVLEWAVRQYEKYREESYEVEMVEVGDEYERQKV